MTSLKSLIKRYKVIHDAVADRPSLPEDAAARNTMPMADGLLDYFPNALAYVAQVSVDGNEQHNAGQPLHWNRDVSRDHGNKILRHQVDFDKKDERGIYHAGREAWRALAQLQELLEREEGYPLPRGCRSSRTLSETQHADDEELAADYVARKSAYRVLLEQQQVAAEEADPFLNKSYGGTD